MHAVLIVGYDDNEGVFIIVNSHGKDFGNVPNYYPLLFRPYSALQVSIWVFAVLWQTPGHLVTVVASRSPHPGGG